MFKVKRLHHVKASYIMNKGVIVEMTGLTPLDDICRLLQSLYHDASRRGSLLNEVKGLYGKGPLITTSHAQHKLNKRLSSSITQQEARSVRTKSIKKVPHDASRNRLRGNHSMVLGIIV